MSGRRLDPETGEIYHLTNKPPPPEIMHRLTQRSDDTADKLRTRLETHHNNVKSVVSYYTDMVAEVQAPATCCTAVQVWGHQLAARMVQVSASQPARMLLVLLCSHGS